MFALNLGGLGLDAVGGFSPLVADGILASLDFSFITDQGFDQGAYGNSLQFLTVSRASVGMAQDLSGNWPTFNNNVGRRTNQGLLIESAATNGVRNSAAAGAVVGAPGTLPTNWSFVGGGLATIGLSQQIVGTGTESGLSYVDVRIFGTPSGNGGVFLAFDAITQIAALYGQTWATSAFVKIVGGSTANITNTGIQMSPRNGAGAALAGFATSAGFASSGALGSARISVTGTPADPTTAFVIGWVSFNVTLNNAIDITLRLGNPQIEQVTINSTVASATVQAGGTGGTGSGVVTVVGGTGTAATLNVTVSGGSITGAITVATAGNYSVFPPSPAAVTGLGLTGATVNLVPTSFAANAAASSPIITNGAAATRAADVVTAAVSPGASMTLFGQATAGSVIHANTGQASSLLAIDDGTLSNRAYIFCNTNTGNVLAQTVNAGVAGANTGNVAWPVNTRHKAAYGVSNGAQAFSFDGAAVSTTANTWTATTTTLRIGEFPAGTTTPWAGYIERIATWLNNKISNAGLQAITT